MVERLEIVEDKYRELQQCGWHIEETDDYIVKVNPKDTWMWFEEKNGCIVGTSGGKASIKSLLKWWRESEGRRAFRNLQFNQCSEEKK